jgi:hypothetical protein
MAARDARAGDRRVEIRRDPGCRASMIAPGADGGARSQGIRIPETPRLRRPRHDFPARLGYPLEP